MKKAAIRDIVRKTYGMKNKNMDYKLKNNILFRILKRRPKQKGK